MWPSYWLCYVASITSFIALVQLAILTTSYIIASIWATICVRGIFRAYISGRTYDQVRLGKTLKYCSLVGDYINLPTTLSKFSADSRILLVD